MVHDLVIGSDEIHAGLVLDEDKRHVPIATVASEILARTITLMAPSKTFNTPGLGCSFAVISDPALRMAFSRAMEGIVPHVNVMGYVAAQAAYEALIDGDLVTIKDDDGGTVRLTKEQVKILWENLK